MGAEGPGGAVGPAEGIGHVAHDRDLSGFDPGVQLGYVDAADLLQVFPAAIQLPALRIQEANAQGADTAHAAVVGGAAADGNGQLREALVQGVADQLAGAVAGGAQGVPLVHGHHGQAGGRRHFQHRPVFVQPAVAGLGGLHQRSVHQGLHPAAVLRRHHRVGGALAAVGYGHPAVLDVLPEDGPGGLGQQLHRLLAGKGTLEGIGSKQEFQRITSLYLVISL